VTQGLTLIKQLIREHPIAVCLFIASYFGSIASKVLGFSGGVAFAIGLPALLASGWAAVGHLITLDDDHPGEWSNPEGIKGVWRASLLEMLAKLGAFVLLVIALWI